MSRQRKIFIIKDLLAGIKVVEVMFLFLDGWPDRLNYEACSLKEQDFQLHYNTSILLYGSSTILKSVIDKLGLS